MKILIVANGYPTNKYGLNGIFEFDQAKALVKAGHEVIYAAVDMRSMRRWRKWGFESLQKEGVKIESINIPCGKLANNIRDAIAIYALKQLWYKIRKKYNKPDIVHAHFIHAGFITAKVFENEGIPLIMTEHYSGMNQIQIDSHLYKIGYYTYKRMDLVIAVSSSLARNINRIFNINVKVIPNIVDLKHFKYSQKNNKESSFSFISVGGLIPRKGMDILIEAFGIAFKNNKDVCLYIYGDGSDRKKLFNKIKDLTMENQIFLMGYSSREEISHKMAKCDCFVLASQLETFGVAYIEALAVGLPVIATKCSGPEDFIHKENGILIPINDINSLEEALKYVYSNISSYNNEEISKEVTKRFSSEEIENRITQEYRKILLEVKKNV